MKNTIIVNVTRKDLKKPYGDPCNCPIATALKREVEGINKEGLRVWAGSAYINGANYDFSLESEMKAYRRSRSFIGLILGGFKMVLTKQHV